MSAFWTYFDFSPQTSESIDAVSCYHLGPPRLGYGWGVATGQASTPFVPHFEQLFPTDGGNCNQHAVDHNAPDVRVSVAGALKLTLTSLMQVTNPSSYYRYYRGRLGLDPNVSMQFQLLSFPGCTVTVAGPQSVELGDTVGQIREHVDDDRLDLDLNGVDFATTKTAACPSTISDTVKIWQAFEWALENVTVTP